jgi:hypothetical protein
VNGHKVHASTWIGILVVIVLVAAHATALLGLAFRGHLSVALVAGMLGLVALKYTWWRLRR